MQTVSEKQQKQINHGSEIDHGKRLPGWAVFSLCAAAVGLALRIVSRIPVMAPGAISGSTPGVTFGTAFADRFSDIVNPIAVNTLGRLSSLVPFSIAELLLIALVLYLLYVLIFLPMLAARDLRRTHTRDHDSMDDIGTDLRERWRCRFARHFKRLAVIAAAMFLIFEVNEDVYFARTRFAARYGLERTDYTDDELAEVCAVLIDEINRTAPLVQRDEAGIMQIGLDDAARFADLAARMRLSMARLSETYPELAGYCPRPKPVIFSTLLSRCDITGVYSMFTVEANINRDMPDYNLPFTMGHELAHLKGFESEKEANFLGFLAAVTSDDPDIRYSGAMLGWIYCGNELHRRDLKRWEALHATIDPAAVRDLDDNSRYWEHYKGKASETMHDINDAYLKTEGLAEGYASYDLVVDMIVTYVLTTGSFG